MTMAQLETLRDLTIPVGQLQRSEMRGRLARFSEESAEHKRVATDPLFGIENSFKVFYGQQSALNDKAFMDAKRAQEAELKAKIAADPKLAAEIGDPWSEIEKAQAAYANNYLRYRQIEGGATYSNLYHYAEMLVRAAQERAKPSVERLPEYAEARLPLLEKQLLDVKPIDAALEEISLGFWLSKTREYLTTDDAAVKALLGKESPEGLAKRTVAGSKLADPAARKALWDGGLTAIQASDDPMIQLVLRNDPAARAVRKTWDAEVAGPTDRAAERVARAKFAAYGDAVYPDATFTPRLSYGKVALIANHRSSSGYSEKCSPGSNSRIVLTSSRKPSGIRPRTRSKLQTWRRFLSLTLPPKRARQRCPKTRPDTNSLSPPTSSCPTATSSTTSIRWPRRSAPMPTSMD